MSSPISAKRNSSISRKGSPAEIYLQFKGGKRFKGKVVGLAWAVVPEDGSSAMGLPNVPRNLDWVRLAQRFPVRVQVEDPDDSFRVGASAVVTITGTAPKAAGPPIHRPRKTVTATPAISRWMTIPVWEFLRREFAPTPGRWQATLRITLACLACTIPIMAFHLKQPAMAMIGMFMLTREDISTTLMGTILAIVAGIASCGLLLLYFMVALDLVWLRVLSVLLLILLGLLMIRVVNPPILGLGVAVVIGFGVTIPDTVSNIETLNRMPFQYCWAWILGLSVNLAVQFLLNPETSQSVLLRALMTRLDAVEKLLRRLAAGQPAGPQPSSLAPWRWRAWPNRSACFRWSLRSSRGSKNTGSNCARSSSSWTGW